MNPLTRHTSSDIDITDLFAGAGGSSTGAVSAGARVRMAANHWPLAVETHNRNHPTTDHDCADISQVDPRRYPRTTGCLISPECTTHSPARTDRHRTDLFNPDGDLSVERSRATMWDAVRFAECHRYEFMIVENVVEITKWPPFYAWLDAMRSLGYSSRIVCLNSMVAHPTPQSRDRIYVVFWREGNRAPDLEIRPAAWCSTCETTIEAVQSWKRPDRRIGKYRQQYVYRCTTCKGIALPIIWPAASAIDWTLPCPRIGDRERPLAPATRRRIELGVARIGELQFYVKNYGRIDEAKYRSHPMTVPLGAITSEDSHGLVVDTAYCTDGRSRTTDMPLSAQTGSQTHALVVKNYGPAEKAGPMAQTADRPLGTVTGVDHHSLVAVPFTVDYHGTGRPSGVADRPLPTQDTRDRHALVDPAVSVDDCGFRMLQPHEIQAAMAFPADYQVLGSKRDQVRQLGNAVTPPAMQLLVGRCIDALRGG